MLRHVKHTDINHVPIRSLHPQEIIRKWSEKEWKEPHIVACVAVSRACENCKTLIKWWGSWTSCPSWTLCPRCKLDISLLTDFATFPPTVRNEDVQLFALYTSSIYIPGCGQKSFLRFGVSSLTLIRSPGFFPHWQPLVSRLLPPSPCVASLLCKLDQKCKQQQYFSTGRVTNFLNEEIRSTEWFLFFVVTCCWHSIHFLKVICV